MKGPCSPYLIDVALNLTDCVFRGVDWKGRRIHEDNFDNILQRAQEQNVQKMIITGTSLSQCIKAIRLCRQYPSKLLCTIGIHPAHSAEFMKPMELKSIEEESANDISIQIPKPLLVSSSSSSSCNDIDKSKILQYTEDRIKKLIELVKENRDVVVAVGEIGLDYAEISYCPVEIQKEFFIRQLRAFRELGLPFLFHSRDCGTDFVNILEEEKKNWPNNIPFLGGIVHSYNGTFEEQNKLLAIHNIYFSINGTAFREKKIADQICSLPLERIMLETDAPWCDIRKQHYGFQFIQTQFLTNRKGKSFNANLCDERRNEPCHLRQVLEAYVGALRCYGKEIGDEKLQNITEDKVIQQVYENCVKVFNL